MTPNEFEAINKLAEMMKILINYDVNRKKTTINEILNIILLISIIFIIINFTINYYFYRKLSKQIEKVGGTNFFERERDNQRKNH